MKRYIVLTVAARRIILLISVVLGSKLTWAFHWQPNRSCLSKSVGTTLSTEHKYAFNLRLVQQGYPVVSSWCGHYNLGENGTTRLGMGAREDNNDQEKDNTPSFIIPVVALIAQPVVWTSLYYVVTTGAGLPSGPFGLLGALEGISYLVILGFVGASWLFRSKQQSTATTTSSSSSGDAYEIAERLSYVSLLAGLIVLASLVVEQGCVPNAKPILDYSDYLPICADQPGLFGN